MLVEPGYIPALDRRALPEAGRLKVYQEGPAEAFVPDEDDMDSMAPDTLRTCEACGGDTPEDCNFCTDGYQNERQRAFWRTFRHRMRKISGTYALLEGMIEEVLKKLSELNDEDAFMLAAEGRDVLHRWILSDPTNGDRDGAAERLREFNSKALEYLTGEGRNE